jgi:Mlc titration factor MtfA (ptsG expression regulator)
LSVWNIWSARWRARREAVALARRAIPDALWRRTLKRFPFLPAPGSADEAELRRLCSLFLDRKEFSGASGLTVTDDMAVAIAAQACLPVLRLGLAAYDGFLGIVVQPSHVRTRRSQIDEDGIVHEFDDELAGEAVAGGPIMLSWRDVRSAGAKAAVGYNVVIHEFAHVLDLADGVADGVPVMPPGFPRAEWEAVIQAEYRAFCQRLADLEGTDQDPGVHHNARGDRTAHTSCEPEPAFTALDPYGASAIDEFFAVASEAFFVSPGPMKAEHPALYELFTRYFSQDPDERFNSANRVVEPPRAR